MSILRRTPARLVTRRAIPWIVALDVAREARRHWTAQLSGRESRRLVELARRSRGRPSSLSVREQRELRRLVDQLDLKALGRHVAVVAVAGRAEHSRRRGR